MRRTRVERRIRRHRDDRGAVLPLDPRDQDVLRAKRLDRPTIKDRTRL